MKPSALPLPAPDQVEVGVWDKPFREPDEEALLALLFQEFSHRPERADFGNYRTRDWQSNYQRCAAALIQKAAGRQLDSASLEKALDGILKHAGTEELAYLPVAAYEASVNAEGVWIVVVNWESPDFGGPEALLGHVRIFAISRSTLKQVAFATCG